MSQHDFDKVLSASKTEASKLAFLKSKTTLLGVFLSLSAAMGYVYFKSPADITPKSTVLIDNRVNLPNISTIPNLPPPPSDSSQKGATISIVDGRTGQSRDVPIGGAQGSKVIAIAPSLSDVEIPKIQSDGLKPYEQYSQSFRPKTAAQAALPRIAIILGGVGLDPATTQRALDILPKEVTLAFAAPAQSLDIYSAKARAKGNELLLQMPYESTRDSVETPFSLKASLPSSENITRLRLAMTKLPTMMGVINYGGDKLMKSDTAYAPIIKELSERGLLVIDDASSQNLTMDIASRFKTAALKVDLVINNDAGYGELVTMSKTRGVAIGYLLLNSQSVEKLAAFTKDTEARGFLITPLSATLARKGL